MLPQQLLAGITEMHVKPCEWRYVRRLVLQVIFAPLADILRLRELLVSDAGGEEFVEVELIVAEKLDAACLTESTLLSEWGGLTWN